VVSASSAASRLQCSVARIWAALGPKGVFAGHGGGGWCLTGASMVRRAGRGPRVLGVVGGLRRAARLRLGRASGGLPVTWLHHSGHRGVVEGEYRAMSPHKATASGADTHDNAKATAYTTSPTMNRSRAARMTSAGGNRSSSRASRVTQANSAPKGSARSTAAG